MKTEVIYNKYTNEIDKASLVFPVDLGQDRKLAVEVVEKLDDVTGDKYKEIKITCVDENDMSIEYELTMENLLSFRRVLNDISSQNK